LALSAGITDTSVVGIFMGFLRLLSRGSANYPGNLCLNGSKPSGRSAQFAIEHVQNVSNAY
jgi:hypothetical protein